MDRIVNGEWLMVNEDIKVQECDARDDERVSKVDNIK